MSLININFIGLDDKNVGDILKNENFTKAVIADLNALAAKNKFSGLEKIKQIHIIEDPFTIE